MNDIDVTVYFNEHRLAALDEVLNDQGRTIEGVLRKCFEETYESLVPEEKREEIETLIRQEEAEAQREAEAARRFAVIHFHEDGDDFHFTSDLRNTFYSAAYRYRNFLQEDVGRLTLDSLAVAFGEHQPIDDLTFSVLCDAMEHDERITALMEFDFDSGIISVKEQADPEWRSYYRELECYHKTDEKIRRRIGIDGYYDLSKLPSQTMQEQFRAFLLDRGRHVSLRTIRHNRKFFEQICAAIQRVRKPPNSFLDWDVAKWVMTLEMWMLENGVPLYRNKVSVYGTESRCEARQIGYLKSILKFLQPEDTRPEREKDVWDLSKLGIQIKGNPIYNVKTLDFTGILQSRMREEVKRAIYLHLKQEKIGTVKREVTSISQFSKYLRDKQIEIQSCAEINRELLEEYLVYKATDGYPGSSSSNNILALRSVLESVGKIFEYDNLEMLFINTDIPPEVQPEFKAYSDAELKRLNAQITKLDVQITRCMVIHQMLGTRISDTLTLRRDCLIKRNGLDIIRIQQVKTRTYEKPISADLAALIQKAIDYTEDRYGATEYIFVDEKDTKRPLQYTTVKHKVLQLILKEDLRDDDGKLFKFNTHRRTRNGRNDVRIYPGFR